MNTKTKGMFIAGAAAALFLSGAVTARAEEKAGGDQVMCSGINACKGQGSCAGGRKLVRRSERLQGQGQRQGDAADCKAKGGKVVEGGHK
jgi:hypothetical protein